MGASEKLRDEVKELQDWAAKEVKLRNMNNLMVKLLWAMYVLFSSH